MAAETLRPKAVALMGCVVTIDAAGCQREVVRRIVAKFADYLISLKGNRGALRAKCFSIQQPVLRAEESRRAGLGDPRERKNDRARAIGGP